MFLDESVWIRRALEATGLGAGDSLLDVGSSSLSFRTEVQPYIDANVFAPLRARGVRVVHLDAKQAPGVDIVADVTRLDGVERTFDAALCTSLLEHVEDRGETVRSLERVVRPGGHLVLTVPRRYPIHLDPIDTGYRPSPEELGRLVGWPEVLRSETVTIRDGRHYQGARWLRRFVRPWQVACLVARRPVTSSPA